VQVNLWNSGSGSHTYSPSGYGFNFTWVPSLPNITSAGLALNGHRVDAMTCFSIKASIIFSQAGGMIVFTPTINAQITFAKYTIITVSTCSGKL